MQITTSRARRALVLAAAGIVSAALVSASPAQVTVGANFAAGNFGTSGFFPPDTMGAVGVDHYVELINGRYNVFRKSDGVNVQTSTLNTFFTNAGVATGSSFDPRILYDPFSQRWFAAAADNSNNANSSYLLARSNGPDPTGGWKGVRIDADSANANWLDFPELGLNNNTVVLSGNSFAVSGVGTTTFTSVVVMPKADLLAAVPTTAGVTSFQHINPNDTGFAPQPSLDMDNGVLPMPLLSDYNTPAAFIKRSSITGTPAAPTLSVAGGFIGVTAAGTPPTADQPGAKVNINTGDNRFQTNSVLNNGEIWNCQSIDSGGRSAIRWYRINASTNAIIESGTITDPSLYLMRPTIAVNDFGDVVIGLSATSPAVNASTYFVTGKTSGGVTTFGALTQTFAGVSDYQTLDGSGRNRWGDYSATSTDPADPTIFWTIQEYVNATDSWADRVVEIIIPQANERRWRFNTSGNYSTAGNWIGGATPVATDHVIYSRPTTSGTGYIVTNPAGTTTNARMSIRQGGVTINFGGGTQVLTTASTTAPGLTIGEFAGNPNVGLTNGTLNTVAGTIAMGSLSTSVLNMVGATWNTTGPVGIAGLPGAAGGTATVNLATGGLNVGGILKIWNNGTLNWTGGTLTVGSTLDVQGGRLIENANGSRLLSVGGVTTSSNGLVDLNNNDMIVKGGSTYDQVVAQIVSARTGGTWNGTQGITSSAAKVQPGSNTNLGTVKGSEYLSTGQTLFDGAAVLPTDVLVKYTWNGDANLDGRVTFDDYVKIDTGFNAHSTGWFNGDFNYSGAVNFDDYVLIDTAFNTQTGTLGRAIDWISGDDRSAEGLDGVGVALVVRHLSDFGPAYGSAFLAAVPEPAAGLLLLTGGSTVAGIRRRRGGRELR